MVLSIWKREVIVNSTRDSQKCDIWQIGTKKPVQLKVFMESVEVLNYHANSFSSAWTTLSRQDTGVQLMEIHEVHHRLYTSVNTFIVYH